VVRFDRKVLDVTAERVGNGLAEGCGARELKEVIVSQGALALRKILVASEGQHGVST
jgi:hypothetical protein